MFLTEDKFLGNFLRAKKRSWFVIHVKITYAPLKLIT